VNFLKNVLMTLTNLNGKSPNRRASNWRRNWFSTPICRASLMPDKSLSLETSHYH